MCRYTQCNVSWCKAQTYASPPNENFENWLRYLWSFDTMPMMNVTQLLSDLMKCQIPFTNNRIFTSVIRLDGAKQVYLVLVQATTLLLTIIPNVYDRIIIILGVCTLPHASLTYPIGAYCVIPTFQASPPLPLKNNICNS